MKRYQRFQARRNHRRFSHNATNIRVGPAAIAAATASSASAPHLLVSTTTSTTSHSSAGTSRVIFDSLFARTAVSASSSSSMVSTSRLSSTSIVARAQRPRARSLSPSSSSSLSMTSSHPSTTSTVTSRLLRSHAGPAGARPFTSSSSLTSALAAIQSTPLICALHLQSPPLQRQEGEAFLMWGLLRRHFSSSNSAEDEAKMLARFHQLMQLHKNAAQQQRRRADERARAMGGLVRDAVIVRGREVVKQTNDFVTAVVATFLCVFLF